ncbi:MAG: SOS response-associated peptidase [Pseudomonadales bacterium]|nr:SOS response-associated peptidase [Halioglobus sp.]MCP5131702.1 SOS response-associated peptidase [Pseudomonadales bacterium]
MCGRFNVIDSPGLQQLLRDLGIDLTLPRGVNLAPTEPVQLVRELADKRIADAARWWLTPSWARAVDQKYAMFNARSETLASSRAFAHPFRSQRGIVPMSSFIEWRKEGAARQPWLITSETEALAVAALWDVWEGEGLAMLSCTLVTTAAAPAFAPWHQRMPVMLAPDEYERWLDCSRVIDVDDSLFRSELKQPLRLQALPPAVGNARNKDPALQQGVGEIVELPANRAKS